MSLPPRPSRPEEPEHINMPQQPNQQSNQLTQECTILQCFDRIKYMILDYQWTCFYSPQTGDLIHIPTKTILTSDIDGYYITSPQLHGLRVQIPIYDLYNEDYVMHTPDPREAVREWFAYVMKRLAQIDLGNP